MGSFWEFLRSSLIGAAGSGTQEETLNLFDLVDKMQVTRLALFQLALQSGVNLIANLLSKCEIRTFFDHREVFGDEYYLWNYAPNANQSASEFLHAVVEKMLLRRECLVIPTARGELLIAESYQHERLAMFPDAFKDVTVRGTTPFTFQRSFRAGEVLFYKLHNQPLEALLGQLEAEYSDLIASAAAKFQRSAGEHGVLTIDANMPTRSFGQKEDGTPRTFNDVYREMMEKQFKSYFKSPNAVMTLWDGFTYDTHGDTASKKSTSDVKDITDLRDQVFDAVATALLIPPVLLKGGVADTGTLRQDLLSDAVDPIARAIERENNRKRNGKTALSGSYQIFDTTRAQHIDVFGLAPNIDKLRGASMLSVNEMRRKTGEPRIDEDWADDYALTKNYESVNVPDSGTE